MKPAASVVIVSQDRPVQLAECLRALAAQREELPALELLVVDDGSTDAAAVAAAARSVPGVRLVRRPAGGVGAARNAGAAEARSELVCFTDDDCLPQPGWARALVARLEAGAPVVAGPTVETGPRRTALALQLTADALIDPDAAATGRTAFAPGSNFACRRSVLERFPLGEAFPYVGAEDREWCSRLAAAGTAVAFEPGAVVLHRRRVTLLSFWRKNVTYGRGARRYRIRHRDGRLEPVRFYAGLLRAGFSGGPGLGAAVVASQVAVALGYVLEVARGDFETIRTT